MKYALISSVAVALLVAGCTMITTVHEYPTKPVVVHDTVYVETHPAPEPGPWTEPEPAPEPVPGPVPEATAPPTGRMVYREQLDPGSATVETLVDHDTGMTRHRMYGNLLAEVGLRFELNVMVIKWENADTEYYLIPQFSTLRNWETVGTALTQGSTTGSPSSSPSVTGVSRSEAAALQPLASEVSNPDVTSGPDSGDDVTSLFLKVGRFSWEYTGEELSDFDSQGLAIGRYEVTVRIPVTLDVLTRLGAGSSGAVSLHDAGELQDGVISEENFINFGTFVEDYL